MCHDRNILAALRQAIVRIDGKHERLAGESRQDRLAFGIPEIDRFVDDGLTLNEMHEIRCSFSRDIGAMYGFMIFLLMRLSTERPVIWISVPALAVDRANLFPDGAAQFGFDASRILQVRAVHLKEALWAAGEAARSGGPAAIVLHLSGNPKLYDLPASRKLMLRSQASGTPFFVLRQGGEEEASSAATRWHVEPASSLPDENFARGVGNMRLTLSLEKNRNGKTGRWTVAWNPQTRSLEHAAENLAAAHSQLPFQPPRYRPDPPEAMGEVMAADWKERRAS